MKTFLIFFVITIFACSIGFSQNRALKESIERGSLVYEDFCITCHMPHGEGVVGTFPPLAKADYLFKNRDESIKSIKYGQKGEIVVNGITYNGFMAPLGLSDDEVADVMNYITNSWENKNDKMITETEVFNIKK